MRSYCEKLYEGLREQIKQGPSDYAIQLAGQLASIRSKYAVWLSEESEAKLYPYEKALQKLGAEMSVIKHTARPDRTDTVQQELEQRIVTPFLLLIGEKQPDSGEEAEKSFIRVIESLRKLLGIYELTSLRDKTISAAMTRLPTGGLGTHGS